MLPRRDGHVQNVGQVGQPGQVLVGYRVFQPHDSRLLQGPAGYHRLGLVPAFGGVHHDADVRAGGLGSGPHPGHLLGWAVLVPHPDLEHVVTLGHVGLGRPGQLIQRQVVPQVVAGVGPDPVPVAAQEAVERLPHRLARGVPEGDIQDRDGHVQQAARPGPIAGPFHTGAGRLDLHDVHPD